MIDIKTEKSDHRLKVIIELDQFEVNWLKTLGDSGVDMDELYTTVEMFDILYKVENLILEAAE